ncbi:hypothetical protein [Carboxylicivirga sp. N1Y90]|uniref:hypothetical protein n=1 Tax=Carboxylicivirga fragile TaxID=3417571 RepID=UPI003D3415E6|nr:hypothetical protein [Marinilabiliaceae bacterium N1Y90]
MSDLVKNITNGRMLKNNGSWMYCDKCNKTIGYLCYSTYQSFNYRFKCKCGSEGSFYLSYPSDKVESNSDNALKQIKNRLCCPNDDSPLFTIVSKNIDSVDYSVTCKKCLKNYTNE